MKEISFGIFPDNSNISEEMANSKFSDPCKFNDSHWLAGQQFLYIYGILTRISQNTKIKNKVLDWLFKEWDREVDQGEYLREVIGIILRIH